jgi:hypothetical protein
MLNSNRIKLVCDDARAASFTITPEGLKISVSLNIKPSMVKYLTPQVRRRSKFHVHVISVSIKEVNSISIYNAYNQLLNKAMINCRRAKQLALRDEIHNLTYQQLTFKF